MLDWFENTTVAHMVQESGWGYPIILCGHAVGMAILVGIVLMINIRVLGFAGCVPVPSLRSMFRFGMIGLVLNVISGTMLFMADANRFFESDPFLVKVALLIIGAGLLVVESRQLFESSGIEQAKTFGATPKILAIAAILVWIGVIVSGRLIAYVDTGF